MTPKQSFVLAFAAAAAAVGALLACSSSGSGGGAPEPDGGVDATAETGADAMVASDAADAAEAAPCSNVPVPDGDVFTACLVQRCCFELTQCTNDCAAYKSCVIACAQMDAGSSCFDTCAMQHSNGQVQLHALDNCGDTKCAPPADH